MAGEKQMSAVTKAKILTLREERKSYREISQRVGFSQKSVGVFLKKNLQTGSLERRKGSGRGRSTSARDNRQMIKILKEDRFQSAPEI